MDTGERRLVATMPLHAITSTYGEEGLRARFAVEVERWPGPDQHRLNQALALAGRLHAADLREREPYVNHLLRVAIRGNGPTCKPVGIFARSDAEIEIDCQSLARFAHQRIGHYDIADLEIGSKSTGQSGGTTQCGRCPAIKSSVARAARFCPTPAVTMTMPFFFQSLPAWQ